MEAADEDPAAAPEGAPSRAISSAPADKSNRILGLLSSLHLQEYAPLLLEHGQRVRRRGKGDDGLLPPLHNVNFHDFPPPSRCPSWRTPCA